MMPSQSPAPAHAAFEPDFLVLRTPLLPLDDVIAWSAELQTRTCWHDGVTGHALHDAWAADLALLRRRLRDVIDRREVLQALFVASPSVVTGLDYWKRDPTSKKGLRAERALSRYFVRMAARCTPFGLFSGCSTAGLAPDGGGAATELTLDARHCYRSSSRLDFDYLFALTTHLRREPDIAAQLRYWPNTSLVRTEDAWHYIESRVSGVRRSLHLVKIDADPFVDAALQRSQPGATVPDLLQAVRATDSEIGDEEARAFIDELISGNVLCSTLMPPVTGPQPMDDIITQVKALHDPGIVGRALIDVRGALAALDSNGLGVSPAQYQDVAARLEPLPVKVDISRLFQVDMIKPMAACVLGTRVIEELGRGLDLIRRLGHGAELDDLRNFREAFWIRYERRRVPLVEVLDEDLGLGFGAVSKDSSPLLRDFRFGGESGTPGGREALPALLLRKLRAPAVEGARELVLDPADLPAGSEMPVVPDSFMLNVAISAASVAAVDAGEFELLYRGIVGPDGSRLFGRFCHADPELERHVRTHLEREQACNPDAIFAEIVFLPEGRIGNVLSRPVLRPYEIVYLGRSGAPAERQLPLSDLLVAVEDGRIVLYSKRLGREIVPRLTNAHGYFNPTLPATYRFLCYLQHQGLATPGFSWGSLDGLDFLPRVRVGRWVLHVARWRLGREDIDGITKHEDLQRFVAVQELRRRRALPRWIVLEESDNTLLVDLDNPLSVDAFVHLLKRRTQATLREMYPPPDRLCVTGPEGRFCHELHVSFIRREERPAAVSRPRAAYPLGRSIGEPAGARARPPGSDWLYLKLYGGPATTDALIVHRLPPILESMRASGALSRWFFLRYADPHHHLRIRFQGSPDRLAGELLPLLSASFRPALAAGAIWKIQLDTYEQEVERYGGLEAVEIAEEIFAADSQAVLEILPQLQGDSGMDLRWRIALLGADRFLSDFGFDLEGKRTLTNQLRVTHARDLRAGAGLKRQLGDRFRSERRRLETLLESPLDPIVGADVASRAFACRSVRVEDAVRRLHALDSQGRLHVALRDLAGSHVHMHINRMIRSTARHHELVIYDFLDRLYDGRLAKASKAGGGRPIVVAQA